MINTGGTLQGLEEILPLAGELPLSAHAAGLLLSRGQDRHISRVAPFFVLIFVREGTLYIEEEGRPFEVKAGQSLLLWPNRHHKGTRDYDPNLKFYWLHFNLREVPDGKPGLLIPQCKSVTRPDFVQELFRRFMGDQITGRLQPLNAGLYAWMILTEVADAGPTSETDGATVLAGRAYTYVCNHFHEKISASDVARAVGCNPEYLSRVFRGVYRQTLTGTIRRLRINHAKLLLIHTNHNVSEVARQSGFEDATYFMRVFKQLEGMTPLRFQRLYAQTTVKRL